MPKNILDKQNLYTKYDLQLMRKSIEFLPDQIRDTLSTARLVKVPKEYAKAKNIVIAGMGGSSLGAHFIKSAFLNDLKIPMVVNSGYEMPNFVNKETIYILSSYSGTTEEPISTHKEAKKRGAKLMVITENSPKSKLKKLMMKENIPGIMFQPKEFNPSNQPRMALGYTITSTMILLAKTGQLKIVLKDMEKIIDRMELATRRLRTDVPNNLAKKIALQTINKVPIIISAEHLIGNLQIFRNQLNENAKSFAATLELPDLNHYAMEGLRFPNTNKKNLIALMFNSKLYKPRNQKRFSLTKKVIEKNGITTIAHSLKEDTPLAQAFEMLQFGSWVGFYMSMLYKINPAPIPYVDWFKEQLA